MDSGCFEKSDLAAMDLCFCLQQQSFIVGHVLISPLKNIFSAVFVSFVSSFINGDALTQTSSPDSLVDVLSVMLSEGSRVTI